MYSLPTITDMASKMLPGLTCPGGKFSLPGNTQMICLPHHFPPSTYLHIPRAIQKGKGMRKMTKTKIPTGGLGPVAAVASMALAPMLLNPPLAGLRP